MSDDKEQQRIREAQEQQRIREAQEQQRIREAQERAQAERRKFNERTIAKGLLGSSGRGDRKDDSDDE